MKSRRGSIFLVLLLLSLPAAGAVIRVPADAPTIQAGIDAATHGDTILVADGTYTGAGNRDIDLLGKAIIVTSENGPENCIIDCEESELRAFAIQGNEGPDTVIEGFTITGADGSYYEFVTGGGILVIGASPVIRGNWIIQNSAEQGGGMECRDGGSPLIEGNIFRDNFAMDGGAIFSYLCSSTIRNNEFKQNSAGSVGGAGFGGAIYCNQFTVVEDNEITDNFCYDSEWMPPGMGGGIYCHGNVILSGNTISGNSVSYLGSAIYCGGPALITGNTITNSGRYATAVSLCDSGGGPIDGAVVTHNVISYNKGQGISINGTNYMANNLIVGNGFQSTGAGGGIGCTGQMTIDSCTVFGNSGCGISFGSGSRITARDLVLWDNQELTSGSQINLNGTSELTISHSDIEGGMAGVEADPDATLNWGPGMINAHPLYVGGPNSAYYLSQIAAGQAFNSPCVDTGSRASTDICFPFRAGVQCLDELITRSDLVPDQGTADMGYHHLPQVEKPETFIVSGPSGSTRSPVVCFTFSATHETDLTAEIFFSWRLDDGPWSGYSQDTTAIISELSEDTHYFQVCSRDTDGNVDFTPALRAFSYQPWSPDGYWQGLATGPGPGPGNPPLVRTAFGEWLAYGVIDFGVNVAAGDIDGDGTDEVITGPGPGEVFGPHVRCFEPDGTLVPEAGFMAYGTHKFGVNVACGDFDGDGVDEIVTGPGPGPVFGPHVRGWDRDGGPSWEAIPGISFFAYGTPKWGVNVACGDIDGDGIDEIITGAGPGAVYGAHVRGWNWDGSGTATAIPGVSYFAYGTPQWGVNVACGDINADGRDEIITGPGPGSSFGAHIRGWRFDGVSTTPVEGVNFFAGTAVKYGAVVACGDRDGDGRAEIVTNSGPSPDQSSYCRTYAYESGVVSPMFGFSPYEAWMTYGGRMAVGTFE